MEPYEVAKRRMKIGRESLMEVPSDEPSPTVDGTVFDPLPTIIRDAVISD